MQKRFDNYETLAPGPGAYTFKSNVLTFLDFRMIIYQELLWNHEYNKNKLMIYLDLEHMSRTLPGLWSHSRATK